MRNHKKVISFDLDGTLVSAKYGDMVWNHGIPEEYAKKYSISFDEAKEKVINEYKTMGDSHILWYDITYWLDRFGLSIDARELLDRYESYIVTADKIKEGLEGLKKRYNLIVASNAARIFVEKELEYTGLMPFFQNVISATTDFGIVKKGEDFYKKICLEMNVRPEEVIHIGDHPVFDYKAPLSIGIEAYLFRSHDPEFSLNHDEDIKDRVIYNLKELTEIL
ncbi:MAG: HAD family hydrolase [Syntrophorhabdaceae bacterium]|nr:HAD family hydrolase [Syntrophorhabdaceae bacterium]